MTMPARHRIGLAAGVAVTMILTACSSGGSPSAASSSSASTSSSSTASSSVASSSSDLPTQSQAQSALLNASDLPGFADGTPAPIDTVTPLPCGQPNINNELPPDVDVQAELDSTTVSNVALLEDLSIWKDASTMAKAFDLGVKGLTCASGTVGGQTVQISGPNDVTSLVGGDLALEFDVQNEQIQGVAIAVKLGSAAVVFQFLGPPNLDTSRLATPAEVAKKGIAKIESHA